MNKQSLRPDQKKILVIAGGGKKHLAPFEKEATTASEKITSEEIQITPKTQAVIDLVNNAVDYTISHSFTECMTYFRNLTNGDINLLVIDQKGTIFIDTNHSLCEI